MKKTTAVAMILVLSMMFGAAAWAEAPADEAAGTVGEALPETGAETGSSGKSSFLSWIGGGIDALSGAVEAGWDRVTDAAQAGWQSVTEAAGSGWDAARESVERWIGEAEAYLEENRWDERVEEAWNTLKEGAEHRGEAAQEELEAAYHTVRDWLQQTGETVDQGIAEAIDRVAGAAGVAEAKVSGWYRKMEGYMAQKADQATESAREAWAVIKQNAAQAGSVADEALRDAYRDLREWLEEIGEPADSEIVQTLDEISSSQEI